MEGEKNESPYLVCASKGSVDDTRFQILRYRMYLRKSHRRFKEGTRMERSHEGRLEDVS